MRLIQSFFLGIFGALGALFLEIIFLAISSPLSSAAQISEETTTFGYFFFLAIAAEEFSKYILIGKVLDKKNIVLNSLFFGLGFSALEMFLVYWNYKNGTPVELIGILGIIIIHISTAIIIGYSLKKNTATLISGLFFGLIPAFLVHLAYNLLRVSETAHQKELTFVLLALLIIADIFFFIKSKNAVNTETI